MTTKKIGSMDKTNNSVTKKQHRGVAEKKNTLRKQSKLNKKVPQAA